MGVGLIIWDIVFFTNPIAQSTQRETDNMIILLLKQIAVIGACLMLITKGKEDSRRHQRSERKLPHRSDFILFRFRTSRKQEYESSIVKQLIGPNK